MKIKRLKMEKNAIDNYIDNLNNIKLNESNLLFNPAYANLLTNSFLPQEKELRDWMNAEYESNPYHMEQLQFKSISGKMLRSKSEVIIDMMLHNYKIPFRYEAKLVLNGVTYYPDFWIIHPRTKKVFYWEHFGMMDNVDYSRKVCDKLRVYCENNIIPDINLIMTFETKDNPLSTEDVDEKIRKFLL